MQLTVCILLNCVGVVRLLRFWLGLTIIGPERQGGHVHRKEDDERSTNDVDEEANIPKPVTEEVTVAASEWS
jgi:hypothetical protein